MKAIIIDNHPLARAVIRNLLENAGVNVLFESDNGAEALKLMKNAQPDVVILDADMPRLSGIEVIVKLRKKDISASSSWCQQITIFFIVSGVLMQEQMHLSVKNIVLQILFLPLKRRKKVTAIFLSYPMS